MYDTPDPANAPRGDGISDRFFQGSLLVSQLCSLLTFE